MSDVLAANKQEDFETGYCPVNETAPDLKKTNIWIFPSFDIFRKKGKKRKAVQYEAAENILSSLATGWDLGMEFVMPGKGAASIVTRCLNLVFRKFNDFITDLTRQTVTLASIAPAMHVISRRVLTAAEIIEKMGEKIESSCRTLADEMRVSAESAGEALEKSERIVGEIVMARTLAGTSLDMMTSIDSEIARLSSSISALEESSKNIGSIIDSIAEISDTTGLLSLNAFIEASRAGTHGAGFGVIAQEIRHLSGQSGKAASGIRETLLEIGGLIENTAMAVRHVQECVSSGLCVSRDADSALNRVETGHSGFHRQLESVLVSVRDQEKAVSEMLSGIAEIAETGRSEALESRKLSQSADRIRTLAEKQLESSGIFILPQYRKVEDAVSDIASDPDIYGMTDNMNRTISEKMACLPYIELVYLTDFNGIQVSCNIFRDREKSGAGSESVGRNWSSREWFRKVKETEQAFISNVYRSAATDSYCLTVSVPVFKNGRLSGVLGADVNFENLLDI